MVDSQKLEHGSRMINPGLPSFLGLGLEDGRGTTGLFTGIVLLAFNQNLTHGVSRNRHSGWKGQSSSDRRLGVQQSWLQRSWLPWMFTAGPSCPPGTMSWARIALGILRPCFP